jgi:hypothetical protein
VQERLAREDPDNLARAFGEAVEVSDPSVADLLPPASAHQLPTDELAEIARKIGETMATKLGDVINTFIERQTAVMRDVQEALLEVRRGQPALPLAAPTAEIVDVDSPPPRPIRVSEFLMERWEDDWYRAGIDTKSFLLQFSVLLKSKVGTGQGGSPPLSCT